MIHLTKNAEYGIIYKKQRTSGSSMDSVKKFIGKNAVMCIALLAAIITGFIIPIDNRYIDYFDYKTLSCLFCVLAVVCALKNINFFYILARRVVHLFKNARLCVLALVYITFVGSMLIANDMALLTFLPLGFFVLTSTGKQKYMAITFILQNIAANLGGMLTPFGNPQNLFLYSKYNIPNSEFIEIMLPPFIISVILITLCSVIFIKPEPLELDDEKVYINPWRMCLYLILFALAIAMVFRGVPYLVGLAIIPAVLLVADRKALKMVDYPLLLTFVFFFIFAGNMARIDTVRNILSMFLGKSTLLFSVLSCQIISNVPSAILLSQFTQNYRELLVGVNIGGVGTLISSLASLITFREYVKHNPDKVRYYVALFSVFNFAFLIVLTLCMYVCYFPFIIHKYSNIPLFFHSCGMRMCLGDL